MQRMTIENLKQLENAQISRIFRLKDPNVDVIYIAPYMFSTELTKYYMKILELLEIDNHRLHIIVPENANKFKPHLSLA
jgi:hypothetical protein